MNIALITPGFSANEQDWCIPVLLNVVRELSREHEVHVFTLRYPHLQGTYPIYQATVHAFGGATRAGLARFPFLFRALTAILAEGRRSPFDVIHGFWADEPGFLAVGAGKLLRSPAVVSLMGGELAGLKAIRYGGNVNWTNRMLTHFSLREADHITVGSAYLGEMARRVGREKLHRLPFGVDSNLFRRPNRAGKMQGFSQEKINLLHIASLVPVKDQETLFRAIATWTPSHPDIHLHIVGDGPLHPVLERLAQELDISSRISFYGFVPHDELPQYYQSADLFVLSSQFESQGMVALEAAACGVTTVGTAVGILPELVPPDQVVAVGDIEGLGRAICMAVEAGLAERGEAARKKVTQEFTLASYLEKLVALYKSFHG